MVTECDMAHLPAENSAADIVIFCLSLMGTNISDYIKEARRVLKLGYVDFLFYFGIGNIERRLVQQPLHRKLLLTFM